MGDAAWSPDSRYILYSDENIYNTDDHTYLYEINTLKLVWQVNTGISNVIFSPNGSIVVGGGGTLQFWNAQTGQAIASPYEGDAQLFPIYSADGSNILVGQTWVYGIGDANTKIAKWENDQRILKTIIEIEGQLSGLDVSRNGNELVTVIGNILDSKGNMIHKIYLWDLSVNVQQCTFQGEDAKFFPIGNMLAVVYLDPKTETYKIIL